jgi:hypothetical protein
MTMVDPEVEAIWMELGAQGLTRTQDLTGLQRDRAAFRKALPILLEWLPRASTDRAKTAIVRALATPLARDGAVASALIAEFEARDAPELGLKWAIADALADVARDESFDAIARLARDRRHGRARERLAAALGAMGNGPALHVLIELLSDDEVAGHAVSALRASKSPLVRPHLVPFANDRRAWVRAAAKKAIAAIDGRVVRALKYGRARPREKVGEGAAGLAETSAGLDASAGPRLLRQVAALVRFEAAALKELRYVLKNLDAGDAYEFDMKVAYEGAHVPLKLWLFSKDGDDLEVHAYSVPSLILAIDAVLAQVMGSSES